MAPPTIYLPNGCAFTATPIFGGIIFKYDRSSGNHGSLPQGWAIGIHTDAPMDDARSGGGTPHRRPSVSSSPGSFTSLSWSSTAHSNGSESHTRFVKPTLNRDSLYISSISHPPDDGFRKVVSPTRIIAMMLWATLWWYFHLEEPDPHPSTAESSSIPEAGRPKADWRVYIKQEGVFKGRHVVQKLERMGLVGTEQSYVGLDDSPSGWDEMFASKRSFWQIDPRIFLFLSAPITSDVHSGPIQQFLPHLESWEVGSNRGYSNDAGLLAGNGAPSNYNRFYASSYLPTYYPPPPPQYIETDGVRHPIRQMPPRQGEVVYTRYIRSLEQTISFRVPSIPPKTPALVEGIQGRHRKSTSSTSLPASRVPDFLDPTSESDVDTFHRWMNKQRINEAWGMAGPRSTQERFLRSRLTDLHLFPIYGCLDDKPFGYFEIYWLKEDKLGSLIYRGVGNWDRGLRFLIGEDECPGAYNVQAWLTSLVHYCWLADNRTQTVISDPRADNSKVIEHLDTAGFYKEGEVSLPHQQCAVMKIRREDWEAPVL